MFHVTEVAIKQPLQYSIFLTLADKQAYMGKSKIFKCSLTSTRILLSLSGTND